MAEYSETIPTKPGRYVYRFWAADGTCLYVGCVGERSLRTVRGRFAQHKGDKAWWPQIVRTDVASFATAQDLIAEERAQIAQLKPSFNSHLLGVCNRGHDISQPEAKYDDGKCRQCSRDYALRYKDTHAEQLRERRARPDVKARIRANERRRRANQRVTPGQTGLF
jgi:hypothetical protein